MALFRNPPVGSGQVGVELRGSLCDVLSYASASRRRRDSPRKRPWIVDLDLANPATSGLNWKLAVSKVTSMDGH